jgi:PleD family two-component response regulator
MAKVAASDADDSMDETGNLLMTDSTDTAARMRPLRVFLADDDPMWRYLTCCALRERGWEVVDFDSGPALLAGFDDRAPDIVLVDALMPEMDGFETCRRLRALHGSEPPVLMLTSLDDELSIRSAYDAGAHDFFIKSTHWALLVERVRHLVRLSEMGRQLNVSNEHLARVHNAARSGSFDFDFDSRTLTGSAGSFHVLGLGDGRTSMSERDFKALLDPDDLVLLIDAVERACASGLDFSVDLRTGASEDGRCRFLRVDGSPVRDANGRPRVLRSLVRDLTDDVNARAELKRLYSHDALTGLPNRSLFLAQAADAIARCARSGQKVAVVVLDLDRFTQINETLGQIAGDELLCQVGQRIRAVAGGDLPRDVAADGRRSRGLSSVSPERVRHDGSDAPLTTPMVARLPGDEFGLIVPIADDESHVDAMMRTLVQEMQAPFQVAQTECFVSASIGIAIYPRDGDAAGTLLSRADRAAREVKARGRNDVAGTCTESEQVDTRSRLEMVSGLHKALERNEFELHFQPWLDVPAARVTGLEALVRWRRDGAQMLARRVHSGCRRHGLIIPIGEWVLQHAATVLWRPVAARRGCELDCVSRSTCPTIHFERDSLLSALRAALALNHQLRTALDRARAHRNLHGPGLRAHTAASRGADRALAPRCRSTTLAPAIRRWPT